MSVTPPNDATAHPNAADEIVLNTRQGAQARLCLFGGQLLSWKPAAGSERLYLSELAHFDGSRPIRGGVPICLPQFGAQGPLPRHGFARTQRWSVREQREKDDFALITLGLTDNDESWAIWPHGFDAELTVIIEGQRIDIELALENTSHAPFAFTAALHTYLGVREVEHCRLEGLNALSYRDQLDGNQVKQDHDEALVVDGPVDRVYLDAAQPLVLHDQGRTLMIEQQGFKDVVVWNPWESGCAALDDMLPLDFRRMLCVEAALARNRQQLDVGESWSGRQTLTAV